MESPDFLNDTNINIDGILFNMLDSKTQLESSFMPEGRVLKRGEGRRRMKHITKRAKAADLLDTIELPKPGETIHVISDAKYDFFNVIMAAAKLTAPVLDFYGSTWTMSKYNVQDLLGALETGVIQNATILTGTYFKRRESSVYAQLVTGLAKYNQRYNAFINHTKVALLRSEDAYIVFEGSANFTANPRLENYIICNNKELYEFHRSWMEELF